MSGSLQLAAPYRVRGENQAKTVFWQDELRPIWDGLYAF